MTNGEKIKEIFPDCFIVRRLSDNKIVHLVCTEEFLNSEYKEPTTKNDLEVDCISRRAVIEEMEKRYAKGDYITKGFINSLPPVTPIRPKGHWISHREHCENLGVMPSGLGAYEWCSNCDCGIDVREWHKSPYNYCPNCGSDNREVEE